MSLAVGDRIPETEFFIMTPEGRKKLPSSEIFNGKKVVLFAVPGAFTGVCSKQHLPSYLLNLDQIKAKGVDTVACLAVNDADVMHAWSKQTAPTATFCFLPTAMATSPAPWALSAISAPAAWARDRRAIR